jgi:hypothetical protein
VPAVRCRDPGEAPIHGGRLEDRTYQNDIIVMLINWLHHGANWRHPDGGTKQQHPSERSARLVDISPAIRPATLISPWEYRHLRAWANVRIAGGIVLACLSVVTLAFGGNDSKTYSWALAFLAASTANFAFAYWERSIARSLAA